MVLHHLGAWLGTHIAAGAANGVLHAGAALVQQTTQHAGEVVFQHVATEVAKNVGTTASSNFWTWVGDTFF